MFGSPDELQTLCERGQQQLIATDYLAAARTLVEADRLATQLNDFDTLSRLYMPLQEARRQRRQRCGEGIVRLDLIAQSETDRPDPEQIIEKYPHGQLLIAGWGDLSPAIQFRALQAQRDLFVETFLAAAFPVIDGVAIVVAPLPSVELPTVDPTRSSDALRRMVPPGCLVLDRNELHPGERNGTWQTFAEVMNLWERLHRPFLAAADAGIDARQKIEGYRRTIEVDYACELAHQRLSDVAATCAREKVSP